MSGLCSQRVGRFKETRCCVWSEVDLTIFRLLLPQQTLHGAVPDQMLEVQERSLCLYIASAF
jgi:hypothetical protein